MKGMVDSVKILDWKSRDMRDCTERRDGCVDGIEVKIITSVDTTHETLKMTKVEVAEKEDLADITSSLHEDDGGIFREVERRCDAIDVSA